MSEPEDIILEEEEEEFERFGNMEVHLKVLYESILFDSKIRTNSCLEMNNRDWVTSITQIRKDYSLDQSIGEAVIIGTTKNRKEATENHKKAILMILDMMDAKEVIKFINKKESN